MDVGEITIRIWLLRRSRSSKVTEFGTDRKLICDFLLVINSNLAPILHRFRDIAFDRSKIAIFSYPSCLTPPAEGFPWHDLRKILPGCQQMASVPKWCRNIAKNFNRLSRAHERYRRQTDGPSMTYSEHEIEFTFAKNKRIQHQVSYHQAQRCHPHLQLYNKVSQIFWYCSEI